MSTTEFRIIGPQPELGHGDETFWSDATRNEANPGPILIVAQYVAEKHGGMSIRDTDRGTNLIAIFASDAAKSVLEEAMGTAEFLAISIARSGRLPEPVVEDCNWDEETKRQVMALYWQNKASYSHHLVKQAEESLEMFAAVKNRMAYNRTKKDIGAIRKELRKVEDKEREVLGGLQPLRRDGVHHLLHQVVDQVLARHNEPPHD